MGNDPSSETPVAKTHRCGACACRACVLAGKGHNRNVREPPSVDQTGILLGPTGGPKQENVHERLHQLTKSSSMAPYNNPAKYMDMLRPSSSGTF